MNVPGSMEVLRVDATGEHIGFGLTLHRKRQRFGRSIWQIPLD